MPRLPVLVALLAALLFLAVGSAPVPAAAQGSQVHKAISGAWEVFLRKTASTDDIARKLVASAGDDAGAAVAKLADDVQDVRKFLDDAAERVVSPAAAKGLHKRQVMELVVAKVKSGDAVHGSIDDVINALNILARQAETAKKLNGGRMPTGFKMPDGAQDVLEAVMARTKLQRAAGGPGGRMWKRADGFYMSLAENAEATQLLNKLKGGTEVSVDELRKVHAAFAAKEPSAFQQYLKRAYTNKAPITKKAADDVLQPNSKAVDAATDNAADATPKKTTGAADDALESNTKAGADGGKAADDALPAGVRKATSKLDFAVGSAQRAQFDVENYGTQMFAGSLNRMDAPHISGMNDVSRVILGRTDQGAKALNGDLSARVHRAAEDMLGALERKAQAVHAAKELNGGRLPEGVRDMTAHDSILLKRLQDFFGQKPAPVRAADGHFYPQQEVKIVAELEDVLRNGNTEQAAQFFSRNKKASDIIEATLKTDGDLADSLRNVLREAGDRLPKSPVREGYNPYLHMDGSKTYTSWWTYFDPDRSAKWLADTEAVAKVDINDARNWAKLRDGSSEVEQVQAILTKVQKGEPLTETQLRRVQKAFMTFNGLPQDRVIVEVVRRNDAVVRAALAPELMFGKFTPSYGVPSLPKEVAHWSTEVVPRVVE